MFGTEYKSVLPTCLSLLPVVKGVSVSLTCSTIASLTPLKSRKPSMQIIDATTCVFDEFGFVVGTQRIENRTW